MLNRKELLIMSVLRKNSRETLTKMSKETKIPISTIYDKIKSQEKKLIKKHTSLLNFSMLGFNIRATILLTIKREDRDKIVEYLKKHQNVNSIFKINNGFDYLVEVIFKQIKSLEEFIELLESKFKIKKYQVYYIIDELKREAFLSNPETIDLLEITE